MQIAKDLSEQIANGVYKEGHRIKTERALAAEHSVSRTTVREALLALEIMGYVSIQVGAGVYVQPRRHWKGANRAEGHEEPETGPHELLDLRRTLEARSAYLAAEHSTPDQVQTLKEAVELMENSIGVESAFNRADEAFHMCIAEMSNNTLLAEYIADLWARRRGALWDRWYEPTENTATRRRTVEDHRQIFKAIQRGRPLAAMIAMHSHIDRLVDRFLDLEIDPNQAFDKKGQKS